MAKCTSRQSSPQHGCGAFHAKAVHDHPSPSISPTTHRSTTGPHPTTEHHLSPKPTIWTPPQQQPKKRGFWEPLLTHKSTSLCQPSNRHPRFLFLFQTQDLLHLKLCTFPLFSNANTPCKSMLYSLGGKRYCNFLSSKQTNIYQK
jgi:hypothetical protein